MQRSRGRTRDDWGCLCVNETESDENEKASHFEEEDNTSYIDAIHVARRLFQ